MMSKKNYCMPNSNILVNVAYEYNSFDGVVFESASLDGELLDTDCLYIKDDKGNHISMTAYFQNKLDEDALDISEDERAAALEAQQDERDGR